MASQSQKDKEKFFADLYALDDLTGDDEEMPPFAKTDSQRPEHDTRRCPRSGDRRSAGSAGRDASGLDSRVNRIQEHDSINAEGSVRKRFRADGRLSHRTSPAPQLVSSNTAPETSSNPLIQPSEPKPSLRRAQTDVTAPNVRKRARKSGPEVPQIFAGQTFFFVPNDDRAVPRKRRIDKAVLHGGTWARVWGPGVTHIIVGSDRKLKDVLKLTGQEDVPLDIALVWDTWLTESLSYNEMRDSTARRFQVQEEHPAKRPKALAEQEKDNFEEQAKSSTSSEEATLGNSQQRPPDDLDDLYEEAKSTQHLPLDFDGEVTPAGSFADTPSNLDEATIELNKGFQCMHKNDGEIGMNPNAKTMDILQEMATAYDRMGDHWRTLSYRKAISSLGKQKTKIETKEQARAIPQIGERLADKIEEIVLTSKLQRLESAKSDPNEHLMQLFVGIYGVGLAVASKWISQGHRTLDDIRNKVDLTVNQRIGLEHYEDFASRIPRAEVAEHARIVQDTLRKFDLAFQLIVGGSYRRGKLDSGDIDCIITKEGAKIEHVRSMLNDSVIPFLFRIGFLTAELSSSRDKDAGSKWQGASKLPHSNVWRRIDLLFVPWHEMGAALIYFTGNDVFNRSIRLLASKRGMRLNQHGLYKDVMRGKHRERITEGTLVEGHSEQRILKILGVPWRPPEHRNC